MPWQSFWNGVWFHEQREAIPGYRRANPRRGELRDPCVVHYNWTEGSIAQTSDRMVRNSHCYLDVRPVA